MKVKLEKRFANDATVGIYPFGDQGFAGYFTVSFLEISLNTGRYVKLEPGQIRANMSLGNDLTTESATAIRDALTLAIELANAKITEPKQYWDGDAVRAWVDAHIIANKVTALKEATQ